MSGDGRRAAQEFDHSGESGAFQPGDDIDAVIGVRAGQVARSGAALHHDGGIRYATIPDTSHFLQFESPEACYRVMRDFLVDVGLET